MKTYALILQNELARRLAKNPKYSLRSFAKALSITPSALSEIIANKRGISVKKAQQLLDRMELPDQEEVSFIESVKATKARYRLKGQKPNQEFQQLSEDVIRVVSDWYHFAILNLSLIDSAKADYRWVSSMLGISTTEARLALSRLERLKLIENKDGRLVRTSGALKTSDGIPSKSVRKLNRELLEKAVNALEEVSVEKRDVTSMVMAIDPANLNVGRTKIKKFRRSLSSTLEKGTPKEVYALTVSLIPLSEVNK